MLRSYDFYYKNLNISKYEVDRIIFILENVENGKLVEKDIRSLGGNGLKVAICEGKYDVFKRLVGPFSYRDGKHVRYKYLLDAISLGLVDFIKNCPSSIMEHWAKVNFNNDAPYDIGVECTAGDAIVLYPSLKKELLEAIYKLEKGKIMTVKIKDVLARQVPATNCSIRNYHDVIYYAELPTVYSCLDLFYKNIITTSNDTGGCYDDGVTDENKEFTTNIIINYQSLDEENKMVADALVESGNAYISELYDTDKKELVLEVPCTPKDSVYTVNQRMMELVSKFHKQDMIYGLVTVEDIYQSMSNWFNCLSSEEQEAVNEILEQGYTSENINKALEYFSFINYYYDNEEDKFWLDEFYYRRHKQYLEEQPTFGGQGLK